MFFNKTSLKLTINYLLNIYYFTFMCFGQLILILIETCPVPFMPNSVLNCYERKWHLQTEKLDLQKAQIFLNVFRFKNDLWTFNNDEYENNTVISWWARTQAGKRSSLQFLVFGTFNIHAAIGSEILCIVRTTSNLINLATCIDTNEKIYIYFLTTFDKNEQNSIIPLTLLKHYTNK